MTIGERILNLRKDNRMSQDELAQQIGISRQTMCRYETGAIEAIPSDKIEKLADILGTTPAYLMGWDEKTQTIPVKVESIDDFENIAIALEAAGAYEEANRVRKDKAENEQMITFIKLFQGLSPENKLEILAKMVMMGSKK